MKNNNLITYVDRLIEKLEGLTSKEWAQNINAWDWNPGVGLMGVVRAAEVTQKKEYTEFLEKWFERNVENRWFGSVNNVAPANVPLYLAKQKTDSIYKEIADEYFDWCVNKSVRTTNNGFGHVWEDKISGTKGLDDYKNQLWIDSIYMTCIFLVKYGLHYGNDEAIKLALEQSNIHTRCLFCEEKDLIFHAYHCLDKENLGHHWGRGNGWFVVTLAELISHLDKTDYDIEYLKNVFVRAMNKILSMREADGMIHTLIDVKEAYKETTGSLLCCYAALKGYECGLLGREFVDWADDLIKTVSKMLDDNDMNLLYCSGGTGPDSKEVYMATPFSDTLYANGLVVQLFSERTLVD